MTPFSLLEFLGLLLFVCAICWGVVVWIGELCDVVSGEQEKE